MMINFANDRIAALAQKKAITSMVVDIDYRGKSIVPARISYIGKGKTKGDITFNVIIW